MKSALLKPEVRQIVLQRLRSLGWDAYSQRRDFVTTRFQTAVGEKQASAWITNDNEIDGQLWIQGSYYSPGFQNALANSSGCIPQNATPEQIEAAVLNFHTMAIRAIDGTFARSLWLRFEDPATYNSASPELQLA